MLEKLKKIFDRTGLDIGQGSGSGGAIRPGGSAGDDIADTIRRYHEAANPLAKGAPVSLGERLQNGGPLGKFGVER